MLLHFKQDGPLVACFITSSRVVRFSFVGLWESTQTCRVASHTCQRSKSAVESAFPPTVPGILQGYLHTWKRVRDDLSALVLTRKCGDRFNGEI